MFFVCLRLQGSVKGNFVGVSKVKLYVQIRRFIWRVKYNLSNYQPSRKAQLYFETAASIIAL